MKATTPEMLDPDDRNAQWRSPEYADFDLSKPRPSHDVPPQDMPYFYAKTGKTNIPRIIRTSSRQDYLTGWAALNLTDPEWPSSGDWHRSGWWGPHEAARPWVNCATMSADRGRFSTVQILGDVRLHDARESLAALPHPAARRDAPVWCAHHDRAIADLAWDFVMSAYRTGYLKCLHAPTVAEWLWGEPQLDSLKAMLEKLTNHVPAASKRGWNQWRSELSMEADWATFWSPARDMGLA